jgi:type VI secretion system protein ImpI
VAIVFVVRAFNMDDSTLGERRFFRLPIRIGRNSLADFQLQHGYVSDFHALVEDIAGRLCVRDLNSRNGVYTAFDGRVPARLAPQSSVDLAQSGFQFFLGAHVRVRIEFEQMAAPQSARASTVAASVLGNQAMLGIAGGPGSWPPPAAVAPEPVPGGSSSPPAGWDPSARVPLPMVCGPPPPALVSPGRHPSVPPLGSPGFEPAPVVGQRSLEAPRDGLAHTGVLNFSLDQMALQGLRELAGSLAPGKALATTGDLARFITKLHDTIEVFCRCFIPLREGYAQFVSSMDLHKAAMQRSVMRSTSYLAAEGAREPAALAAAVLDWQDRSMDAPKAIEEIFADLMIHQVALLDGVMQGVRGLLEQLAPENIERQVDADPHARFTLDRDKARYKAIWETYSQMYEQLADEKRAFAHIFGPQFTEAYREYRRQRAD